MAEMPGNALLSVFDKTGVEDFAKGLADLGWKIYASGGTAAAIKKAGVEVTDTVALSGGGAILGHRVVTLSREIYAGILAGPEQEAELKKLGLPKIDLVCVDMYPLSETVNDANASEADIIEKTDVGGPTLLHAAAKGRRIVLSRAEQRQTVLKWLKNGRPDEAVFIRQLAAAAELEVATYMFESADYLGGGQVMSFIGERIAAPKYGENPWQGNAGLFISKNQDPLAIDRFSLLQGNDLSYNNYTDIDRLLQTVTHVAAAFDRNYGGKVATIALGAKHGNICGAGYSEDPITAIEKMLNGDERAIFGGSIIINRPLNKKMALTIMGHGMEKGKKRILDIVVAPAVDKEALEILQRKNGKLRIFVNPALASLDESSLDTEIRSRYVRGGCLKQDNYTFVVDYSSPELEKNGKQIGDEQCQDMLLAWAVGSTGNSNTISIVKGGKLLSNGVGQQDRVTAAELALMRARNAGHSVKGASAYSDSFFPFTDAAELLAEAGIESILTTRGSIRDGEVTEALTKAGVAFYTLPDSSARGFYAH